MTGSSDMTDVLLADDKSFDDLGTDPIIRLASETRKRSQIIALLQIGGSATVLAAIGLHGHELPQWPWSAAMAGFALALGVGFLLVANAKGFASRFLSWFFGGQLNRNQIEVDEVVTSLGFAMMLIDLVLCGAVICLTGGISTSYYTPLLLSIPGAAFTLRLPKRKLLITIGMTIAVALTSWDDLPFASRYRLSLADLPPSWSYSWVLTSVLSVVLTLFGGLQSLRTRLPEGSIDSSFRKLQDWVVNRGDMEKALRVGIRRFMADAWRDQRLLTISRVHDVETVVSHSILVMLPHGARQDWNSASRAAYLLCAAHWIDDFFDGKLLDGIDHLNVEKLEMRFVVEQCRHLRRIYRSLKRRLPEAHHARVDRGFTRILIGGNIQHREGEAEIAELFEHFVKRISDGVDDRLKEVYQAILRQPDQWIVLWGSAKSALELFDGIHQPEEWDLTLSELYSILYGPIFVCQDLDAEAIEEGFSLAFRRRVVDPAEFESPSPALEERLVKSLDIFESRYDLWANEEPKVVSARRRQLEALLHMHGESLPARLMARYESVAERLKSREKPRGGSEKKPN